jgi:hypothetical protein
VVLLLERVDGKELWSDTRVTISTATATEATVALPSGAAGIDFVTDITDGLQKIAGHVKPGEIPKVRVESYTS